AIEQSQQHSVVVQPTPGEAHLGTFICINRHTAWDRSAIHREGKPTLHLGVQTGKQCLASQRSRPTGLRRNGLQA
ncbi:MAG: hypothetical protein ACRDF8_11035, partial [Chloroflexota bacterium]